MNPKQVMSLISLTLGVLVLIFAFDGDQNRVEKKIKQEIITNSPISPTERLPEIPPVHLQERNPRFYFLFFLGAVMVGAGGISALYWRDRV